MYLVKRRSEEQMLQAPCLVPQQEGNPKQENKWVIMEDNDDDDVCNTSSLDNPSSTIGLNSSSDMIDDASSSSPCSSTNFNGPLYELSELMTSLPIKRGLSKFYQGKSQSFTSLSGVTSIADLAKKEIPYRRKMRSSKSCGNGFVAHKPYTLPKAIIAKKVSRGSMSCLLFPGSRGSFLNNSRLPSIPVDKKF